MKTSIFIVRFTVGKDDECRAPCEMCRIFNDYEDAKKWHEELIWIRRQSGSRVHLFNLAHVRSNWFIEGNSATPHPSNFGGRGWQVLEVGDIERLIPCQQEGKP